MWVNLRQIAPTFAEGEVVCRGVVELLYVGGPTRFVNFVVTREATDPPEDPDDWRPAAFAVPIGGTKVLCNFDVHARVFEARLRKVGIGVTEGELVSDIGRPHVVDSYADGTRELTYIVLEGSCVPGFFSNAQASFVSYSCDANGRITDIASSFALLPSLLWNREPMPATTEGPR